MGWFDDVLNKVDEAVTGGLFSTPAVPQPKAVEPAAPVPETAPAEPTVVESAEDKVEEETIARTSKRLGVPAEAPYRKDVAEFAQKKRDSIPAIVGRSFELNDIKSIKELFADDMKALPQWESKLEDTKRIYDERAKALGEKEATLSMIGLFTQLVLGMYGTKHGVDTSGIRFDKINWDNQFKQLARQYDKDSEFLIRKREAIKERISQKYRMLGEEQQVAEQEIRDYEKIREAEWKDRYRALEDEERAAREAGRAQPKTSDDFAAEAQVKTARDMVKKEERKMWAEKQALKYLDTAQVLKGKDRKKALAANLGMDEAQIEELLSPSFFADTKENYATFLKSLKSEHGARESEVAKAKRDYYFMEAIAKSRLGIANPQKELIKFKSQFILNKKKNKDLDIQEEFAKYLKQLKPATK